MQRQSDEMIHRPTGVKCLLCPLKDHDSDPVDLKMELLLVNGKYAFVWWKSPPKFGKTQGCYCYYCGKIWYSFGKSKGFKTIGAYKDWLAAEGKVEEHWKMASSAFI